MRVVVTGASSYSGMCIAREFARRGHATEGLLAGSLESYRGRKRVRIEILRADGVELHGGVRAEDGQMAAWASTQEIDLWVHHHHPMENFRSPSYDVDDAARVAIRPLAELAVAWRMAKVRGVLCSGTYFEPGEGGRDPEEPATPYARLKNDMSSLLREEAHRQEIGVTKIVIPSPTGALENEDRLTPQLILAALGGKPFSVRSPNSIFDHIDGEILARVYADAGQDLLDHGERGLTLRPSGWTVSTREWVEWARENIIRKLDLELEISVPPLEAQSPPTRFSNPSEEKVPSQDREEFAERYVREWRQYYPFF